MRDLCIQRVFLLLVDWNSLLSLLLLPIELLLVSDVHDVADSFVVLHEGCLLFSVEVFQVILSDQLFNLP